MRIKKSNEKDEQLFEQKEDLLIQLTDKRNFQEICHTL